MTSLHGFPDRGENPVLYGLSAATVGPNPYWGYNALKETRR